MKDYITLKDVKSRYKEDLLFVKTNPKLFIINLFTQNKQFRHWEYMWIKVIIGLIRLYFVSFICRCKFWIACILSGHFPWEIK